MKRLFALFAIPMLFAISIVVALPQLASAATDTNTAPQSQAQFSDPATEACNKSGCNIIRSYVNPVIVILTYIVGLAVTIGIIIGGIQVTTSAGDPQKSANGKKHIQNALIGLVSYVVLFAFLNFLIPGGIGQ